LRGSGAAAIRVLDLSERRRQWTRVCHILSVRRGARPTCRKRIHFGKLMSNNVIFHINV
jgi:hypothetical protein